MTLSRRRICTLGGLIATTGLSGCLGGGDDEPVVEGSEETDTDIDDWAWDGTLSVTSAHQYHDPDCGCCSEYVAYLRAHDIDVAVTEVDNLGEVKTDLGVPNEIRSCHTLELEGYLIEGHVPLEAIDDLLTDEPAVRGIGIPGMPQYSPGMGPRGDEALQVYAFDAGAEPVAYTTV
ncbi:metal-binding protein [Salinadaptatus halalkaliphilus]|uniref:Metal-binding protein n=1 Tax=Salinadaptatus halalkaliphilus TaxID=2419781 RepID=A0A4S3TKQ8_9EURY|nr:DUF411 domain-containing protein [Salinadaptatus halalkaliphilus]THE64732.1 metal-binding protein [Salinadaptatus halalkaliphilus]